METGTIERLAAYDKFERMRAKNTAKPLNTLKNMRAFVGKLVRKIRMISINLAQVNARKKGA